MVRRVMTGNGSPYVSHRFAWAIKHLGAKHIKIRPYTPRTSGKAERFIQTSIKEWPAKELMKTQTKEPGGCENGWIITTSADHIPPSNTNRQSQYWQSVNNVLENNNQAAQPALP